MSVDLLLGDRPNINLYLLTLCLKNIMNKQFKIQLSTTDLLALASMKNAAKCDT